MVKTFARLIAILALALMPLSGCVNVHTRWPTSDTRIEDVYQSTECSFDIALIVAFPQVMGYGSEKGFIWENCLTIPLGLLVLCDTVCEAVVDTVCLPYDWPVSDYRNRRDKRDDGDGL